MDTIAPTTAMEIEVTNIPNTFYFPSDVSLFLGSARRKADTNLAVIELVRAIDDDGRFATPDEIARTIVFVASPAAVFMTGATVDINGGRDLR